MRKVIKLRFFILAALMVITISAFAFMAYKQAHAACSATGECYQNVPEVNTGETIWDVLSHQFVSYILYR